MFLFQSKLFWDGVLFCVALLRGLSFTTTPRTCDHLLSHTRPSFEQDKEITTNARSHGVRDRGNRN